VTTHAIIENFLLSWAIFITKEKLVSYEGPLDPTCFVLFCLHISFFIPALSKVLTCEIAPTGGDILVFGRSIKSDANAIRRMVGVCKQDDYLWPNLSAKEHLDLFAGLRGVDPSVHEATVQKWLESVDLDSVQHQHSSQFSGGMKRRLSLAMSTIGSRALIVLDEPTTGNYIIANEYWMIVVNLNINTISCIDTHTRRYGPSESTFCVEAY
jgi:ABC-type multidrug transport system ATPase subunit